MVREMEKSVAVTVFFDEGLSQEQIDAIGEQIRSRTEVADVVFVTAEEAWDEYKEIYFEEAPELADGFEDDNPLANEAHYEIYLTDVESQDDLVTWLESVEGIRRINESAQVADILTNFNLLIGYISIAVILLLLCVFCVPDQQYSYHRYRCQKRRDCDYEADRSHQWICQGAFCGGRNYHRSHRSFHSAGAAVFPVYEAD